MFASKRFPDVSKQSSYSSLADQKVSKKLRLLTVIDYTRGYEYPTTIPDRSQ
jgi:hypothetical protein